MFLALLDTIVTIAFIGWVVHLLLGPKVDPTDDRLSKLLHEHEFFVRRPKTRVERFFLNFFSSYKWGRKFLGGTWEAYVHDMGTWHAIITWHWVEKRTRKTLGNTLFRIEEYDYLKNTPKPKPAETPADMPTRGPTSAGPQL